MGAPPPSPSPSAGENHEQTRLPSIEGFRPSPLNTNNTTFPTPASSHSRKNAAVATFTQMPTYERVLSNNELSYYLPSRANGVNDMHLHVSFNAPKGLVTPHRLALVWAILRVRHPLLSSRIEMKPGEYDSARYVYTPPASPTDAYIEAQSNIEIHPHRTEHEFRELFSNGPRMLSSSRPTCLCASWWDSPKARGGVTGNVLIASGHYVGDGQAMHFLGNDFFLLLGGYDPKYSGEKRVQSEESLAELLVQEWTKRWGAVARVGVKDPRNVAGPIPAPTEDRIPAPVSKIQAAAHKVEFKVAQEKFIGGQTFPRVQSKSRHGVINEITVDRARTEAILAQCKAQGVTVQNAIFVLCNYAWIRTMLNDPSATTTASASPLSQQQLPTMMYTAVNLRPYMGLTSKDYSYFFLAVAYFNVVLPSFLPRTAEAQRRTFWHRARDVKAQGRKAIKNPMLIPRSRIMNEERGKRSKRFAKEDDELLAKELAQAQAPKTKAVTMTPTPPPLVSVQSSLPSPIVSTSPNKLSPPPSVALIGLSLLGDLDDTYKHASYPSLELLSCVSSTRKSQGGMLLFSYTFKGQLWLSLGYDAAGFKEGVVEEFWTRVESGIDEFLLGGDGAQPRAML